MTAEVTPVSATLLLPQPGWPPAQVTLASAALLGHP